MCSLPETWLSGVSDLKSPFQYEKHVIRGEPRSAHSLVFASTLQRRNLFRFYPYAPLRRPAAILFPLLEVKTSVPGAMIMTAPGANATAMRFSPPHSPRVRPDSPPYCGCDPQRTKMAGHFVKSEFIAPPHNQSSSLSHQPPRKPCTKRVRNCTRRHRGDPCEGMATGARV
jgi:hypothetical protein